MNIATSPVLRLSATAITPLVVVVMTFVLLAGHNQPGGGFAAGLLAGAGIVIRDVADLRRPTRPRLWLAGGGLICAATAFAPVLFGNSLLDQTVVDRPVGVLGTLKTGTAIVFDVGVVAIVVGLVLTLLDGLAPIDPVSENEEPSQ